MEEEKFRKMNKLYKEGYDFLGILACDFTYYEALTYFLNKYKKTKNERYLSEYVKNCAWCHFPEGSYLYISDLHLGSKEENLEYIKEAFRIAKSLHITEVFNGGDLGDGMVHYKKEWNTYQKQVDHILNYYPEIEGMTHYITLGNHDKKYERCGIALGTLLEKERSDIKILGERISYYFILDHLLSLEHQHHPLPKEQIPALRIEGHSHRLQFQENKIKLPTLSDSNPMKCKENSYLPGFCILTASKKEKYDSFVFSSYQWNQENGFQKSKEKKYFLSR